MRIIPNQIFKHDGKTYETGESYDVSEDDAAYFQEAGWVGERRDGEDVALEIQNIQLGHSVRVN